MTTTTSLPGTRRPAARRWATFTVRHPSWAGYAAASWSAAHGMLGVLWALGAGGFPFGVGDAEAADMGSLLVGVRPSSAGPVIAVLGAAGAALALVSTRARPRPVMRLALAASACGVSIALLVLIPDVRLMRDFAYLFMLNVDKLDWPTVNQLICVAGGLLWAAAAVAFQRRTAEPSSIPRAGRRDASWVSWGRRATLAAVLLPVPYEAIRWRGRSASRSASLPARTRSGMRPPRRASGCSSWASCRCSAACSRTA
jgi:hypothetical protein